MRWPHTLPPRLSPVMQLVVEDYTATRPDEITVRRGDTVHLLSKKESRCLVQKLQPLCKPLEGWVPSYVIGQGVRKNRSFRLRKLGFSMERLDPKAESEMTNSDRSYSLSSPIPCAYESSTILTLVEKLSNVTVFEGKTAAFNLKVSPPVPAIIIWTLPNGSNIVLDTEDDFYKKDRIKISKMQSGCCYSLEILDCVASDAGLYTFKLETANDSLTDSAELTVLDTKPSPPGRPHVIDQSGETVGLQWNPPSDVPNSNLLAYQVQFSLAGTDSWQNYGSKTTSTSQVIKHLKKNHSYLFRVYCTYETSCSDPGPVSNVVSIPFPNQTSSIPEDVYWKEGFRKDFSEIAELGRGRFAIVKSCTAKNPAAKHKAVAAKLINKGRKDASSVEKEYFLLRSLQNLQIPQALEVYDSPHHYVLILELVSGPSLLEFLCTEPTYDEGQVIVYMRQLLRVLCYLHSLSIVHLDIKPENLLIDCGQSPPLLQLVDFGDAHHLQKNPFVHSLLGNPEFGAPEVIRGHPVSLTTDVWSLGVLIYVLLCGMSPFYEKGVEETCINIVRVEFTFPEELFGHVSNEARQLIIQILQEDPSKRPSSEDVSKSRWFTKNRSKKSYRLLSSSRLASLTERRRLEQQNIRNIQVT